MSKLSVPTLALHGTADPIAPVGAVRAYAEQIHALQLKEFTAARHDVVNEAVNREVATAIIDFVYTAAGAEPSAPDTRD